MSSGRRTPVRFLRRATVCALLAIIPVPGLGLAHSATRARTGSSGTAPAGRADVATTPALRIVGPGLSATPVVNEGNQILLSVVNRRDNPVGVTSWASDSEDVASVSDTGVLRGIKFGFATITARPTQGDAVRAFVVVARVSKRPGMKLQGDTKTDSASNVYLSSPQKHAIYKVSSTSAQVFAGRPEMFGYSDGPNAQALFNAPTGLGVDNTTRGGIFVADTGNHCIRKAEFAGSTAVALGRAGSPGRMVAAVTPMGEERFNGPSGVAVLGNNLLIVDTNNHAIYYADFRRRVVQLVAGQPGVSGNRNGDGPDARFDRPTSAAINAKGDLLAVADTGNNAVRLVELARTDEGIKATVSTLGLPSSAAGVDMSALVKSDRGDLALPFTAPKSVSFDGVDNVYVVESAQVSVVIRSGVPTPQKVALAESSSFGSAESVSIRGTAAIVLDSSPVSESDAVKVVEVGPPEISALSRDSSVPSDAMAIRVNGKNFAPESLLTFGDRRVDGYSVKSATEIEFTLPAQQFHGALTLTVQTRGGVIQKRFDVLPMPLGALSAGHITTVAGGGIAYAGDGGSATDSQVTIVPRNAAVDALGNLYVADTANNRVRRIDAATGVITTVAGNGSPAFNGDGIPATSAGLDSPYGVAVDGDGNLLISDTNHHRIRRVDRATQLISTFAGVGVFGDNGDGLPASSTKLAFPRGIALDAAGNLLVADEKNFRIRVIDASTLRMRTLLFAQNVHDLAIDSEGSVFFTVTFTHQVYKLEAGSQRATVYAGTDGPGYNGDGRPAATASLSRPGGLALDADDNLFVADSANARVRRIDRQTGLITTVVGNGDPEYAGDGGVATRAGLAPHSVLVDGAGNLIISDGENARVRAVNAVSGLISTVAGSGTTTFLGDGGFGTSAHLSLPGHVASDGEGALYISDGNRVRRIDLVTGIAITVAGGDEAGFSGDGGPAVQARLSSVSGLAIGPNGDLYIADTLNNRIRRVDSRGIISTFAGGGTGGDGTPAASAALFGPVDVAWDTQGKLYIANASRIQRVDASGIISTVSSGHGGLSSIACDGTDYLIVANSADVLRIDARTGSRSPIGEFSVPFGVAVDARGAVYVSENYGRRVVRVDVATRQVIPVAGTGGVYGDGGSACSASLELPAGIEIDPDGNLFVVDRGHSAVRVVHAAATVPGCSAGPVIDAASYAKPELALVGRNFQAAGARVCVNDRDVSSYVRSQTDGAITLRGGPKKLNLRRGANEIVVEVGSVASAPFVLIR